MKFVVYYKFCLIEKALISKNKVAYKEYQVGGGEVSVTSVKIKGYKKYVEY